MKIIIAATKTCKYRPILEKQLQYVGLQYKLEYFEDNPELIEKYGVKISPLFIVDGKVLLAGMPEHSILTELEDKIKAS